MEGGGVKAGVGKRGWGCEGGVDSAFVRFE